MISKTSRSEIVGILNSATPLITGFFANANNLLAIR